MRKLHWSTSKDKYGRTVHHLYQDGDGQVHGQTLGAVVKLPKVAVEARMLPYLSNDWTAIAKGAKPGTTVEYHTTLGQAKARIEALAGY